MRVRVRVRELRGAGADVRREAGTRVVERVDNGQRAGTGEAAWGGVRWRVRGRVSGGPAWRGWRGLAPGEGGEGWACMGR